VDPTPESSENYDLCYKCHDRGRFVTPQGRGFPHTKHVVDQQTSCAVCHDAHGSRQYPHLINFMLRDKNGRSVVSPNSHGDLKWEFVARDKGRCSLSCHGSDHKNRKYP
jgi:hypothetical protein